MNMRHEACLTLLLLAPLGCGSVTEVRLDPAGWQFSDPAAFAWRDTAEGVRELALTRTADYRPPVRAPQGIALSTDGSFADFEIEAVVRQDGREYPHRDLCIFFAYRDATHFGYAHLASSADDNAHGVFLVDGAPRRQVTTARSTGVAFGAPTEWHRVRVVRAGDDLRVWFDDGVEPVLIADARAFGSGHVGFGSFDDTGALRSFVCRGESAPNPAGPLFTPR